MGDGARRRFYGICVKKSNTNRHIFATRKFSEFCVKKFNTILPLCCDNNGAGSGADCRRHVLQIFGHFVSDNLQLFPSFPERADFRMICFRFSMHLVPFFCNVAGAQRL